MTTLLTSTHPRSGVPRLVTLTGVGGVGKTHLALAAATAAAAGYRDNAWLVDLTQYQDPELVSSAIAAALGHHDHGLHTVLESLALYVADRNMLLVLDNCEHLITAVANAVATLLDASPRLHVLVTSREPLHIQGERVIDVPPLEVPSPDDERDIAASGAPIAAMQLDSVRLLVSRAEDAGAVAFGQTADPVLVARLLRQVDGIPLGIVLAASRLRSCSLEDLLAVPPQAVLTRGQRDAHDHHQSITASIDWSYRFCSPAGRTLWTRLGVFSAPCGLHDVIGVCADSPTGSTIDGQPIIDVLGGLVQQSVVSQQYESQSRYFLLDTMRQYARARLDALGPGETAKWRSRHAEHYLQAAVHAGGQRFSREESAVLDRVRRDMPHFRTALDWLLSTPGGTSAALRILINLSAATAWFSASTVTEGSRYITRALASTDITPGRSRVIATAQLGWHGILQRSSDTEYWIDQCRKEVLDIGDIGGGTVLRPIAYWQFVRGLYLLFVANEPAAVSVLSSARHEFRGKCPVFYHLTSLYTAAAAIKFGDRSIAETASKECLDHAESHGAVHAVSWAGWVRGWVEIEQGRTASGRDRFRRSLRTHQQLGTYWGLEWLIGMLAWGAAIDGQHHYAAQLLGAAAKLRTVSGNDGTGLQAFTDPHVEADVLTRAALSAGDYSMAFRHGNALTYNEAIALALDEHSPTPPKPANSTRSHQETHAVPLAVLTTRQQDVARLMAQDKSNDQIATTLHIGKRTVETHVSTIYQQLGVHSRLAVAQWFNTVSKGEQI